MVVLTSQQILVFPRKRECIEINEDNVNMAQPWVFPRKRECIEIDAIRAIGNKNGFPSQEGMY